MIRVMGRGTGTAVQAHRSGMLFRGHAQRRPSTTPVSESRRPAGYSVFYTIHDMRELLSHDDDVSATEFVSKAEEVFAHGDARRMFDELAGTTFHPDHPVWEQARKWVLRLVTEQLIYWDLQNVPDLLGEFMNRKAGFRVTAHAHRGHVYERVQSSPMNVIGTDEFADYDTVIQQALTAGNNLAVEFYALKLQRNYEKFYSKFGVTPPERAPKLEAMKGLLATVISTYEPKYVFSKTIDAAVRDILLSDSR
jgi:hypothetical protein